jgi:hypothetical protein
MEGEAVKYIGLFLVGFGGGRVILGDMMGLFVAVIGAAVVIVAEHYRFTPRG